MHSPTEARFDRTNALIGFFVFAFALVVYVLTMQRTVPFWDSGEFVAISAILGIPHPPGFPLYSLLGRVFILFPFFEDLAARVNFLSAISSAGTALFAYLLTVRLVNYFFSDDGRQNVARFISYVAGVVGALFVAFSATNWENSVEAEVYGLALALSVALVWMAIRYHEAQDTPAGIRWLILSIFVAMLGVGIHLTVFLVIPVCAIFYLLRSSAGAREYALISGYAIAALFLIILFADTGNGYTMFLITVGLLGLVLLYVLRHHMRWGVLAGLLGVGAVATGFNTYLWATLIMLAVIPVVYIVSRSIGFRFDVKTAFAIILAGFMGISVHAFIWVRSDHNPRIDMGNPDRDWQTFIDFLDRKQYGATSMVERMFNRRGQLSNQLGTHAHMGFWGFFSEQYNAPGSIFVVPLLLGIIGMGFLIWRRMKMGLPLLTLFLATSLGLALYMNFADGTRYNQRTGDAYLEVRDRDYFFTPAFVVFGIAIGIGVGAVMTGVRNATSKDGDGNRMTPAVYASSILILLPAIPLTQNYHRSDRSADRIAYNYAYNLLASVEENGILFTAGDNDTYPVWALQEVYNHRRDVTIANLSLLNTDWYVKQMRDTYGLPINLTDAQIDWYPAECAGLTIDQPREQFFDAPRQRRTFLSNAYCAGPNVLPNERVANMMTDMIVLNNRFERPIYFGSSPWNSPLGLTRRVELEGMIFALNRDTITASHRVDIERSWKLFMEEFRIEGFNDASTYRDNNATGVMLTMGANATRLYDALIAEGDTTRAEQVMQRIIDAYPEYWQAPVILADLYDALGDSTRADSVLWRAHDSLSSFMASNDQNIFYPQDLGLIKNELARRPANIAQRDQLIEDGIDLLWKSYRMNTNSVFSFRKLVSVLSTHRRLSEMQQAANIFANYGQHSNDQFLRQILQIGASGGAAPPPQGGGRIR